MMEYRVISAFNDRLDSGFLYKVGAVYPRQGIQPTTERILELSTSNNSLGKPLIEKVEEKQKAIEKATQTQIDDTLSENTEAESVEVKSKSEPPVKKRRRRYEDN